VFLLAPCARNVWTLVKLKGKGVPGYVMKTYRGSRFIAPLIFKLSTGRIRTFDAELSEPQVIITTLAPLSYSFESNETKVQFPNLFV
jgi:hypothetical protein